MDLLTKPEYIALLISVIAITVNVYIAYRNRKHALAKEEYFKLQQVVEKIISKLLILENHKEKLKVFFELSFRSYQNKNVLFIDTNDTFNKTDFERNGEEIASYIDIYFGELGNDWSFCLEKMSALYTQVYILNKKIENETGVNWKEEQDNFNSISLELDEKPKLIAGKLKEKLKEYKEKNL